MVKTEKFGCNGSHKGPDCCRLAPEDRRVQQNYRGIYAPLPHVDTCLWPLFRLGWRLFTFDGGLFTRGWRLFTFDGDLGHAVDKFAQLGLGQRADFGVDGIAAFKHDQGRDAADVELAGHVRVGVDVDLTDFDLARVFCGNLLEDGGNHLAGATPLSPKIHQHGQVAGEHLRVEVVVGHVQNVSAHRYSVVRQDFSRGLGLVPWHRENIALPANRQALTITPLSANEYRHRTRRNMAGLSFAMC